jgi:putative tryptophan/tyrosine transport system substrate-binding protein
MRAPTLIAITVLYVVAMPVPVQAGQARAVPEVGVLLPPQRVDKNEVMEALKAAFVDGLQALGYVEGKNIHIELRIAGKPEDLAEMALDLVNRKVDVIATTGPQPIEAARRATATIPIVIIACDRADRLVASIARPGGNITGMACISSDLGAKRLELLREMVPTISRVMVLLNSGVPAKVEEFRDIQAAAQTQTMEIEVQSTEVRDPAGFVPAFAAIKGGNSQALLALADPLTFFHLKEIAEFAVEQRLPSMYGFREFCDAGGLLCYGANLKHQFRRYGYFIDKILKGTKPGDIPIEEPTIHELIVNARTAKLLGVSIPNSILIRADDVIE